MAKLTIKKASTDVTTYVFIQDSSKTTGEGLTGLAYNTASLVGYYVRPKGSATAITLATQTVTGDHSDGGFVEIDATNMPGVYRLDLPDAVCATGVPSVVVMLKGATNMSPVVLEIQLTDFDLNAAGVTLATSQPAITWAQQKIVADVDGEGALYIQNTNDNGFGKLTFGGLVGEYNYGLAMAGVRNQSDEGIGTLNDGYTFGVRNAGISGGMYNKATGVGSAAMFNDAQGTDGIGLKNVGEAQNVEGFDPAIATATKLQTVDDIVDTIKTKTDNLPATPASAGEYTAAIAAIPTAPLLAANYTAPDNASIATIKAKTNLIPANPAVADEYDAALAAIQADLDNPDQYKADVSGIPAAVWGYATRTLSSFGSLIADIWSHVTRTLSSFGFTVATNSDANVTAIKAKTDNLPATPASAGEYTSALTAIQNDLDNPSQYKADVSNLALQATSLAIKGQTDKIPAAPAQTGEYNAALAAIQSDLDNPNQYKADVSGLATQASVNAIPTTPLLAENYTAPDNATIGEIKAKTDNIPATPLTAQQVWEYVTRELTSQGSGGATAQEVWEYATRVLTAGTNIDLTPLAKTTHLQEVEDKVDGIKGITDQLTFTVPNKVDASADVVLSPEAIENMASAIGEGLTEEIWSSSVRTLTQSPAEIIATVLGGDVTQIRGNSWVIQLTGVALESTQQFAIKYNAAHPDSAALLFVDSVNGLTVLNGVAQDGDNTSKASLVYDGAILTITVDASITAQLPVGAWQYGIQSIADNGIVAEPYGGSFRVLADIVRAID